MELEAAIAEFEALNTDAILYTGPIEMDGYEKLSSLLEKKKKRKNILLYLITNGGNPNAGYRVARAIGHHYGIDNFRVAVPAECKSAGTLICVGAKSLVIFDKGELGPLDVQFRKRDEIFEQSSGLDILRGMTYLRTEALETFREYLIDINSGSGLSTKTASEIASKLVIGLYEPMYAQIDPIRLGELNAALGIAEQYGTRLSEKSKSLKPEALNKLINSYTTHAFVIDRAEARNFFDKVEAPTEFEKEISKFALLFMKIAKSRNQAHVHDLLDLASKNVNKDAKIKTIKQQGVMPIKNQPERDPQSQDEQIMKKPTKS
jgi:hypothetical protein